MGGLKLEKWCVLMSFHSWNKIPSDAHSCLFHALTSKEKEISSRAWTEELEWSDMTYWRATKWYLFENDNFCNAETLFYSRSNLICLVCRCAVRVFFALQCICHCVRVARLVRCSSNSNSLIRIVIHKVLCISCLLYVYLWNAFANL